MGGKLSAEPGRGRVTLENTERESFGIVQVSDDVVRKFRGSGSEVAKSPTSSDDSRRARVLSDSNSDENVNAQNKALNDAKLENDKLRNTLEQKTKELGILRERIAQGERQDNIRRTAELSGDGAAALKLRELENSYRTKVRHLDEQQETLLQEQAKQFREAVEKVERKFLNATCQHACSDREGLLLQCYLANTKQTLTCSAYAKQYEECVFAAEKEQAHLVV